MKYGLTGKFFAAKGKGDELAAILMEAAKLMKPAEGCFMYVVGQETDNPDTICISEVWKSKEHHDASLHMEGVAELIGRARPLMDGRPESTSVDVLGGVGITD